MNIKTIVLGVAFAFSANATEAVFADSFEDFTNVKVSVEFPDRAYVFDNCSTLFYRSSSLNMSGNFVFSQCQQTQVIDGSFPVPTTPLARFPYNSHLQVTNLVNDDDCQLLSHGFHPISGHYISFYCLGAIQ